MATEQQPNKMNKHLVDALLGRSIAFRPELVHILGSINAALFVSQLFYWTGKGSDPDGWIWKTQEEFEEETCLSRKEQEGARRLAVDAGVLLEEKRGIPCKLWYKLDIEKMAYLIENYFNSSKKGQKTTSLYAPNGHTGMPQTDKHTITLDYTLHSGGETKVSLLSPNGSGEGQKGNIPLVGPLLPPEISNNNSQQVLPSTFEEFMENEGYYKEEIYTEDSGVHDGWFSSGEFGKKMLSLGKVKLFISQYEKLTKKKGAEPEVKDTFVADVVAIWNRYPTSDKVTSSKIPNTSAISSLLPPVSNITKDLRIRIAIRRKQYPDLADWEKSIKSYVRDICSRIPDEKAYYKHRFSLYEFVNAKDRGIIRFMNR